MKIELCIVSLGFAFYTTGLACSVITPPEDEIKKTFAAAITKQTGVPVGPEVVTDTEVYFPLGLGADCSGLAASYRSAGFRFTHNNCEFEGFVVSGTERIDVQFEKNCR